MEYSDQSKTTVDQKLMAIGPKSAIALFVYYLILLITSTYFSIDKMLDSGDHSKQQTLLFSIFLSITGATIFYLRKLYKACISDSYNFQDGTVMQRIGTFMFFVLRPLFAIVFSFLINIIWTSTIITSVKNFSSFSETHFYISGAVGFFVGFLAGRILTRMEMAGERHLSGVW